MVVVVVGGGCYSYADADALVYPAAKLCDCVRVCPAASASARRGRVAGARARASAAMR